MCRIISTLRHEFVVIALMMLLCPLFMQAQRRYSAAEQGSYHLARSRAFTTRQVANKMDAQNGLHASQYEGAHHLLGFSAEGGWSAAFTNMPSVNLTPGGMNAGLRVVYEFQYSGFILQTGLGLGFQRVTNSIGDTVIYHEQMHDVWNGQDAEFTLKHSFYDRRDMAQQVYAQLPLYVGNYIPGAKGLGYFLVGAHLNYAIWGSTKQTLVGTSTGLYERYVGIWEEMDNHGFRKDVPIERQGDRLKLKINLMAHAEIGYEFTSAQRSKSYRVRPSDRKDYRIRLGAFADFGILDVCPKTNNAFYYTPTETIYDFPTYEMHYVFSTEDAKNYWLRHLNAGIRISVLFGFQNKERCILCNPWQH